MEVERKQQFWRRLQTISCNLELVEWEGMETAVSDVLFMGRGLYSISNRLSLKVTD